MLATRQLEIVENCHNSSNRPLRKSSSVSSEIAKRLETLAIPFYHPKGTVLFNEGQPSGGVFLLHSGRVKLSTSTADGKTIILRFVGPGEMIGLAAALSGQPQEARAEAIQPTQTSFVERTILVRFMRLESELALRVAMELGESYCSAIAEVRQIGHWRSASKKLATFLLDWCESNRPFHDSAGTPFTLTQEEIGQVIGISRETAARLLSGFKKKGLIVWKGCNLVLVDSTALQRVAES